MTPKRSFEEARASMLAEAESLLTKAEECERRAASTLDSAMRLGVIACGGLLLAFALGGLAVYIVEHPRSRVCPEVQP